MSDNWFLDELAQQIYYRDGRVKLMKPLFDARPDVALRIHGDLDELEAIDVKVLAYVCDQGYKKHSFIAGALNIEEKQVQESLNLLYQVEYIDEGYQPTTLGMKIILEVGVVVLEMDKHYMEPHLDEVNRLLDTWKKNYSEWSSWFKSE